MKGGFQFCRYFPAICLALVAALAIGFPAAYADNPGPQSGSIGLEGTIPSTPPSRGPTIAVPANGAVFTAQPITVSGLCPSGLLIKVFDNGIFVGSTICVNGSYTLQINLFEGRNDLIARDYDALDQTGPDSSTVSVTFNDTQFLQFGTHISLTSNYAERGAAPESELDWPIQLSGGTSPFAFSVDWGDNSPLELLSVAQDGTVTIKHTYRVSGVYSVVIKAVDKNSETAILQLVGQATGALQSNNKTNGNNIIVRREVEWWPALAMLPLIFAAFWAGRRYELRQLKANL